MRVAAQGGWKCQRCDERGNYSRCPNSRNSGNIHFSTHGVLPSQGAALAGHRRVLHEMLPLPVSKMSNLQMSITSRIHETTHRGKERKRKRERGESWGKKIWLNESPPGAPRGRSLIKSHVLVSQTWLKWLNVVMWSCDRSTAWPLTDDSLLSKWEWRGQLDKPHEESSRQTGGDRPQADVRPSTVNVCMVTRWCNVSFLPIPFHLTWHSDCTFKVQTVSFNFNSLYSLLRNWVYLLWGQ